MFSSGVALTLQSLPACLASSRCPAITPCPVACDQVRGARGRGQGTETVAKLGGLPPSDACVSQRLRPEHASDDELRRGFLHSFGIWAVPPLMIRGELAI